MRCYADGMFRSLTVKGVPKLYLNECLNDLWIREIVFPDRRNGYFVEAGAADGISGSSCFLLERQLAWRGICIEPDEDFFTRLSKNRPGSICENVCLAAAGGPVDFVVASDTGGHSPFLNGVRTALEQNKWRGDEVVAGGTTVIKQAVTLEELLSKHGAPRVIEYGAFDIEGSEFEALRSFPFDRYRFLALSLELDGSIADNVTELLLGNGYREVKNPFNADFPWERYFLHSDLPEAAETA